MQTQFSVRGMTCGGCARRVQEALLRHAERVEVSLEAQRVRVEHRPEVDPVTLARAIQAAGYEVEL